MASFNSMFNNTFEYDASILLHPTIPKPLHTVNPRTILGRKWWDIVRNASYEEKDYHCHACGVHKSNAQYKQWLEGHEYYKIDYRSGRVTFDKVVALCHCCHSYIHEGRLQFLLEANKISTSKYTSVLAHGKKVLKLAGHTKFRPDYPTEGATAPWRDWYMLVEGKKYFSPFEDYAAWERYHKECAK